MYLYFCTLDTVMRTKPNVRFDDIAGLLNVKEALREAVIYPRQFPLLFKGKQICTLTGFVEQGCLIYSTEQRHAALLYGVSSY